jgi:predicted metal-dependent hydrolase
LPDRAVPAGDAPARTIVQGGRAKAYRPLPDDARLKALRQGLAAYRRGDFFEAHELLEPAWMGASDPIERDYHQGLIKLAAAYVHAVRGNPLGMTKNLRGARERLAAAEVGGGPSIVRGRRAAVDLDLGGLVAAIDDRLARLERGEQVGPGGPPRLTRRIR